MWGRCGPALLFLSLLVFSVGAQRPIGKVQTTTSPLELTNNLRIEAPEWCLPYDRLLQAKDPFRVLCRLQVFQRIVLTCRRTTHLHRAPWRCPSCRAANFCEDLPKNGVELATNSMLQNPFENVEIKSFSCSVGIFFSFGARRKLKRIWVPQPTEAIFFSATG